MFDNVLSLLRPAGCLVAVTVALSACQKPVTNTPTVSKAEITQEQRIQRDLADQYKEANTAGDATIDRNKALERLTKVSSDVQPAAIALCQELYSRESKGAQCNFNITLAKSGGLNAYADGEKVVMFPEMIAFTQNNTELAMVLAHELAHNIMRHPDNQKQNATVAGVLGALADAFASSQGFNTGGGLAQLGAQSAVLAYSSDFEREADYVGMYILQRAGYDISEAPNFWRRMSAVNPDSIYVGTTHPTNPERYIGMNKTMDEIRRKYSQQAALLPDIKAN